MRAVGTLLTIGVVSAALAAACGGPATPVQPSTSNPLVGRWSGAMLDKAAGAGTLTVDLNAASVEGVTGTWSVIFPVSAVMDGGTVASVSSASALPAVSLAFTCRDLGPSGFNGSGGIDGRLDGGRLTGSFFTIGCGPLATGTIDLTRHQ